MSLQEPTRSFWRTLGALRGTLRNLEGGRCGSGCLSSILSPSCPASPEADLSEPLYLISAHWDRPPTSRKQWGKLGGPDSLARAACLLHYLQELLPAFVASGLGVARAPDSSCTCSLTPCK